MKKFCNFIFHLLALLGITAGVFYLYQKYFLKEVSSENMEDDDFEDFDFDDEDFTETGSDAREYVTLNASESKNVQDEDDDDDFDEIYD